MFCSTCGRNLSEETVICPYCGCGTKNWYEHNNERTNACSNDYLLISRFHAKARTIRTLGIFAAIFMLGFLGIIFSIVIWVKANGLSIPRVHTKNPLELAELQEAIRKLELGKKLALLPLIVICIMIVVSVVLSLVVMVWTQ